MSQARARPRLLVVNGCEHTCSDDGTPTWAAHLADRLALPLVNLGAPRASNHRIVRTTLTRFAHEMRQHDVEPRDVLFVAMLTSPDRTEVRVAPSRGLLSGRREVDAGDGWSAIGPWSAHAGEARAAAWYDHLYHEVGGLVSLLLDTVLLGAWLDRSGARHVTALAHPYHVPTEAYPALDMYARRIDPRWIVGGDVDSWRACALMQGTSQSVHAADRHKWWTDNVLLPRLEIARA